MSGCLISFKEEWPGPNDDAACRSRHHLNGAGLDRSIDWLIYWHGWACLPACLPSHIRQSLRGLHTEKGANVERSPKAVRASSPSAHSIPVAKAEAGSKPRHVVCGFDWLVEMVWSSGRGSTPPPYQFDRFNQAPMGRSMHRVNKRGVPPATTDYNTYPHTPQTQRKGEAHNSRHKVFSLSSLLFFSFVLRTVPSFAAAARAFPPWFVTLPFFY